MELHEVKTTVLIQQVKLNVRFPGQLSFSFKNPHLYQEMNKMYPLTNGQCPVLESAQFTQEVAYNSKTQTYRECNIDLSVSINTSSGKIVAGVVSFNSAQNQEEVVSLKRCSDKNATVSLAISIEKIRKIKDLEGEPESERIISVSPIKQIYSGRKNTLTARLKTKFQEEKASSKSSSKNILALNKSVAKVGNVDSRIREMEENQERKLKIINEDKKDLEDQLDKAKERWRMSERREKEGQGIIKELKDSNEKKKMKILELQSKLMDNDRLVFEYEKKGKVLQAELKSSNQHISLLDSKVASLQKKIELKDQTFGERQKKLMQKIANLEANSSKALQDYNTLIEKMQSQQKNNQGNAKAKEKGFIEQKMKWKEQSEELQHQITTLNQLNQDLQLKVNVLSKVQEELTKRVTDQEHALEKGKTAFEAQRVEFEKEKQVKEQLQKDLSNLYGVENDKATLKKRTNQQVQENQKLKDKLDKLTLDYQEAKEGLKRLEDMSEELRKEKKALIAKATDMQKVNVNLDKEVNKLQGQNNSLSSKNTYLTERFNDMRTKMEQKEREFSEDQVNSNNTINSILQAKEYLENDLQDLRWALEKEKENINQAEKKIRQNNQKILNQEEEALKLQKELENFKVKAEENLSQGQSLKSQIRELKKKQRENLQTLKSKDLKLFELSKKITQLQQQNFLSSSKFKSSNIEKDDLICSQETTIKQLTTDLNQAKTQLTQIQLEHEELEDKCRQLERNLKMTTNSLQESERNNSQTENRKTQLNKEVEALKKKLLDSQDKKTLGEKQSDEMVEALKNTLEQTEKQLKSKVADVQTFKKSVQQLLLVLASQKDSSDDIIALPDPNLARNQLEALMNRNKNIEKINQKIIQYEVQINYLEKENENKAKHLHDKEEQLLKTTQNNKQKLSELQQQWSQQKLKLTKNIEKLNAENEDITTEKEKLEAKLKGVNQLLQEEKREREEAEQELQKSKEINRKLEGKVLEVREREISKKSEDQTYIHNIKVELTGQIQTYKEKVNNLLKEKENMEKLMSEKDKIINLNKARITQLENTINYDEEEINNLKNLSIKKDEDKVTTDQKLQEEKKKTCKLEQSVNKLKVQLKGEKELRDQIENKLKETREELSEISIEKQNLLNKFKQTQENSTATTQELKAKVVILEDSLQAQMKKTVKLSGTLSNKVNQLEIKEFKIKQLEQQVQQTKFSLQILRKEDNAKKTQIVQLEKKMEELKSKIMETESEKSEYSLQKGAIGEQLSLFKSKLEEKDLEIKDLNLQIENLSNALEDLNVEKQNLTKQKSNLTISNTQLRQNLTAAKKDVQLYSVKAAELKSRLAIVQEQLKEKEQFYQSNKSKNWDESQREINSLKSKIKKCEDQMRQVQRQREKERQDLQTDFETFQQEKDELESMLEERDDLIERQEQEIVSAQNRIISLNNELRNCIEAWEKEKTAALPSRKQANKIEQDLVRFQQYASSLDSKTKETLKNAGSKVKDELIIKMGQQIVELLDILHRSKLRVLSNIQEDQKQSVIKEYDSLKEKIQDILQSQKGSMVLDSP